MIDPTAASRAADKLINYPQPHLDILNESSVHIFEFCGFRGCQGFITHVFAVGRRRQFYCCVECGKRAVEVLEKGKSDV